MLGELSLRPDRLLVKPKQKTPEKALPVTLLSGFLGSGKTTLLQHILRSDHGLRIAVIVNDIGAINVDASLIKQTHRVTKTSEKIVALQNGCICCTLRGDLLEELVNLAELHAFDYVIIESSGISEPEQVAETFDNRLADQMRTLIDQGDGTDGLDEITIKVLDRVASVGGLEKFARLDTTVTVIDAFTILNDFHTDQLLSARRDDVVPEDERTITDLMVDQIEFADVIILNKIDMVDNKTRSRVRDLISNLNHRAKVIETTHGKVDVTEIVNTGLFNLDIAKTGYGWLQDLHAMSLREVNGKKTITPKPETEEYNVRNFVYSRQRPFHPRRLWSLVYDKFILQFEQLEEDNEDDMDVDAEAGDGSDDTDDEEMKDENQEDDADPLDMPSNEAILANKRAHPLFSRLFRSKGEFFLATRPRRVGDWSQAGAMLTLTGGRLWFCTLPEEAYITGDEEIDSLIRHDISKGGEWGDRRQEIVFIGENLDTAVLTETLDKCLLTDKEFDMWEDVMRNGPEDDKEKQKVLQDIFDDGFPDWPEEDDEGDHEGHDHGPGHHH
ncbi:CobW/HypB/UreG, nucleotide-binding domain-containing protein [Sodiomyces alkalinus F11]|uniref:CobW/HypB/UreG, nucleotide-binding domain-containing protein n=1 Tax=Sodiomyces alkalinus (strain CBS 110278 / VKM F-3762 / F11) TaxID=1314773 RepID=A0A3N2PPM1_SODAK|nr:CobW/HypB/UreG, nucleotide-binding domain-containing protein [Sodiomyces alkalinus F11]ROT36453.1 CobW/HypB/UreG, nucleotide-binding domain-containing protein [Sodiomyces alkalinus F11]